MFDATLFCFKGHHAPPSAAEGGAATQRSTAQVKAGMFLPSLRFCNHWHWRCSGGSICCCAQPVVVLLRCHLADCRPCGPACAACALCRRALQSGQHKSCSKCRLTRQQTALDPAQATQDLLAAPRQRQELTLGLATAHINQGLEPGSRCRQCCGGRWGGVQV